jgi:hypothetical protein
MGSSANWGVVLSAVLLACGGGAGDDPGPAPEDEAELDEAGATGEGCIPSEVQDCGIEPQGRSDGQPAAPEAPSAAATEPHPGRAGQAE